MARFYGAEVEDALFLQARSVVGTEFEDWIGNLSSMLQSNDRGPSCLTLLRQTYVLTASTKYNRSISPELYKQLMSIVLEPEQGSIKVKLIAATILRELSPSQYIEVPNSFSPPIERGSIPHFLPVLLAQTNLRDKLSQVAPKIVEFLVAMGFEEELSLAGLCTLHSLCTHPRGLECVEDEVLRLVSVQLASWLKQANTLCLPPPTTGLNLFGSSNKKQLFPVKEIDATPSQGIFTILNLGVYYSADQLLNIHAFSTLRRWLLTTTCGGRGDNSSKSATPTLDNPNSQSGLHSLSNSSLSRSLSPSHLSFLSASMSSPVRITSPLMPSLISPGAGSRSRLELKDVAVQYCLRVIEQCERKPTKSEDARLLDACLYECIAILDLLCSLSSSLIHTVFPKMHLLYSRVAQDPVMNSRLLLVLLKFFVNHGESEMYDVDALINLFFGKVLSIKFNDPPLAYEVIAYLLDNMERLHSQTNIFTKFFPNILKILAWSPVTFVGDFLQLLPAFISETTIFEVFHSLLDLPCLTATLQAHYILSLHSHTVEPGLYPQYASCLAAFQDTTHRLMFGHFLRSENGKGDTIDHLGRIHNILMDFVNHERVKGLARVAPLLLKIFFKVVMCGAESHVIQLASVLLERIVLLYDMEDFSSRTRRVMADQLLLIYERHPQLVVDHHQDLLNYLGNLHMLNIGGEHCYMHLVWLVGEYSQSGCSVVLLNQYFGTLESVAYEVSINFHKVAVGSDGLHKGGGGKEGFSVRLLMLLMSTIAKLASRCQDLIPRTLLCLNKIVKTSWDMEGDKETHKVLLNRANELVNVLKMPSLASAVLSPPAISTPDSDSSISGYMARQTNITHLLQYTVNHLNIK